MIYLIFLTGAYFIVAQTLSDWGRSKPIEGDYLYDNITKTQPRAHALRLPHFTYRSEKFDYVYSRKLNKYLYKQEKRLMKLVAQNEITKAFNVGTVLYQRSQSLNFVAVHKGIKGGYWKYPLDRIKSTLKEVRKFHRDGQIDLDTFRVYIEKPNGKLRPLGVPDLYSRVVLGKLNFMLSLLVDRTIGAEHHGFLPDRSCVTAWKQVLEHLDNYGFVYEFDLKSCFNRISYDKLMEALMDLGVPHPGVNYIHLLVTGYPLGHINDDDPEVLTFEGQGFKMGLPQGWSTSPKLALLVISKAFKKLFLTMTMYADDGLIFFKLPKSNKYMQQVIGNEVFAFGLFKQSSKSGGVGNELKFLGLTYFRKEKYFDLLGEKVYRSDPNLGNRIQVYYLNHPKYKDDKTTGEWKIVKNSAIIKYMPWKVYVVNLIKGMVGNQLIKRYGGHFVDYVRSSSACMNKLIHETQPKTNLPWRGKIPMKHVFPDECSLKNRRLSGRLRKYLKAPSRTDLDQFPEGVGAVDAPMADYLTNLKSEWKDDFQGIKPDDYGAEVKHNWKSGEDQG